MAAEGMVAGTAAKLLLVRGNQDVATFCLKPNRSLSNNLFV